MSVSLDGFIVGPAGGFDWGAPDEEVFRFWIDEIREVGVHLLGRRLYETMLYWETADQDSSLDDSPWTSDPTGEWQRWHEAGADEVIVTARTQADVDALVAGR